MQTSELIAELEAATGPDRELDAAIGKLISFKFTCWCTGACHPVSDGGQGACGAVPRYTASIDAALALAGDRIRHIEWCEGFVEVAVFTERYSLAHGAAATPALAICIAALRARNEGEGA